MSQNIGTLISSSIRPNDSLDPIASAYASEIKGGLHTSTASSDRDATIFERREWGMMCYVINDDKTYQLTYNYVDTNLMNDSNWVEFSGSGGGGGGDEWIDSVLSVLLTEPGSPSNGDRYLVGSKPSDTTVGVNWSSLSAGFIAEWNSTLSSWTITSPTDGMSVRVDNEDNSIYKYETNGGLNNYPNGTWEKEKSGLVRSITSTSMDGFSYSCVSEPPFSSYEKDMLFLSTFDFVNNGTASLNINGLGDVLIKKPTPSGVTFINPYDITTDVVYSLVYDGNYLQLNRTYVNEDLFNVKYYVEPTDYIVVPPYYQYWVFGDLTIDGSLVNYGHVVISNGNLITNGTFSNYGSLAFINIGGGTSSGLTTSYYDTDTIEFSSENTIFGPSVSAIVSSNSLTSSHLNTGSNGGATAGYILSVDDTGSFSWRNKSTIGGVISYSDKSYIMSFNTSGDGVSTGLTISKTPVDGAYVGVFINGQEFEVGYGTTNSTPCYFSNDGGITARSTSPNNVQIGDELYWNGNYIGTDLYISWRISLFYQE